MVTRKRSRAPKKRASRKPKTRKPAARTRAARPKKAAAKRSAPRPAVQPRPPSAIGMTVQHMDYTSQAMDEVRRFYTELLGFETFMHETTMNYLLVTTGPSSSIGFMPPMEGSPDQWRPPREPNLYFMVEDVDRAYRALRDRGVSFDEPPRDMPWGHRVANLRDPEGRRVCLAQPMKR